MRNRKYCVFKYIKKLDKRGYTLTEALVTLVLLGMCTLLLSAMISDMKNNITSINLTRGLYSVMENILETYQIDVTRERDIATGNTVMEMEYNGKLTINEINVKRAVRTELGPGYDERIYIISIKSYYKDKPKHFISDRVIMTKGVGINAV